MNYQVTLWKLTGRQDEVDGVFEFFADTHWNAIELFDLVCRGQKGHYRAWLVDTKNNNELRMSEVSYARIG